MVKFVVDMMGGDNGPKPLAEAILSYLKVYNDMKFYCVGKIEEMEMLKDNPNIELIDARDEISMEDAPMTAIKKKESSMIKAINVFKLEQADAILSTGGTAAYLTGATLLLGRLKGVKRPALVSPFPTVHKGQFTTILDIGANSVCTLEEMHQFALMGDVYHKAVFGVETPKVMTLSNGTEDHKGTPLIQDTNKLLKEETRLNYLGHIEARNVLSGDADVVVCDGFSGNILLKSIEGTFSVVKNLLKSGFKSNIITMLGYVFSKKVVKNITETFNYKAVGGAMLLGINGVVVKAHGNSDIEGFTGALNVARRMVDNNIVSKIRGLISENE